jgi:hypothetical protein
VPLCLCVPIKKLNCAQNKRMKVVIIGGGIIGLSSAYYLHESGHDVTVIDKTDMTGNCSYGNAGYVCPSHFIPLATPGIVKQGLKWMWNSKKPFLCTAPFKLEPDRLGNEIHAFRHTRKSRKRRSSPA